MKKRQIQEAKRDNKLITIDGKPIIQLIEGVKVRQSTTISDDRGTLCEVLSNWSNFHKDPIIHVYQFTIRPNKVKGWVVHHEQDDRLFISIGTVKIVLYDDRPDSPTFQKINEIYISEFNRSIVYIPRFVYHALHNVGSNDVLCINLPTKAYNYDSPDKYRLPLDTTLIPYKFKI